MVNDSLIFEPAELTKGLPHSFAGFSFFGFFAGLAAAASVAGEACFWPRAAFAAAGFASASASALSPPAFAALSRRGVFFRNGPPASPRCLSALPALEDLLRRETRLGTRFFLVAPRDPEILALRLARGLVGAAGDVHRDRDFDLGVQLDRQLVQADRFDRHVWDHV